MKNVSGLCIRARKPSQKPNYWKGGIYVYWDLWFRRWFFFSKMITVRVPLSMDLSACVGQTFTVNYSNIVE